MILLIPSTVYTIHTINMQDSILLIADSIDAILTIYTIYTNQTINMQNSILLIVHTNNVI